MLHCDQVLDVSNNSLTGSLPPELSQATTLVKLNLGRNAFVGPVPSVWANLTQLQSLVLDANPLQVRLSRMRP